MKLEPEGRKRLEAMKKTLAAGVPLAGMLAASAAVGAATQGCLARTPMGRFPAEPQQEEWVLDGDIAPVEQIPPEEEFVTMGEPAVPGGPEVPENPEIPENPEPETGE